MVVFNPFGRPVAINQVRVTACSAGSCVTKDLPSSEVVLGKNAIVSRSMWIALKNVKCATPSNPFAYCAVIIYDSVGNESPYYYCMMRLPAKRLGMNGGPAHLAPPAPGDGGSAHFAPRTAYFDSSSSSQTGSALTRSSGRSSRRSLLSSWRARSSA